MDYGELLRFSRRHGNVSILDTQGKSHMLPSGDPDTHDLVENADRFLWDGVARSRAEMESLIAQSERGLRPGCLQCERLEKELIAARERDRKEENLDMRHESDALRRFQDHRHTHQ